MYTFKLDDIPTEMPIHHFLMKNTDVIERGKKLASEFSDTIFLKKEIPVNFETLKEDVNEALELYPPLVYAPKEEIAHECYKSLFLTCNPYSNHPILNPSASHKDINHRSGKNSLTDFISNNRKSPAGGFKSISTLIDRSNFTVIGSRLAILDGAHPASTQLNFQWHIDASIFISTRINIPINSSPHFGIQILTPDKKLTGLQLEEGYMYLYNTNLLHRPTNNQQNSIKRVNLILSLMPWFNIDHESSIIYSNEHYGISHPFELFQDNILFK